MDDKPKPPRNRGRFVAGQGSPNPGGRPKTIRQDATETITTALVKQNRNVNADGTLTRRDSWQNAASGHGTARDRRRLTRFGVDIVTDIEALQLRRSNWLAAAIIEDIAKEAWKRGWHLKCEDKELDVAICKQAEHLGMDAVLIEAASKAEEAGGSAIFPVLEGALGDLSAPLNEGAIVSVKAFHVFEPQELTPVDVENDLNEPGFRKPTLWRLQPLSTGRSGYVAPAVIHTSRLVIFGGVKVSVQTQPGQREGWGDSCLCRPWEVISDFGLAWGSAATLLQEHGKATWLKEGLADMLAQSDGLDQLDRHLAATNMSWTTMRMRLADAKDKIEQSTGTLAGVSDVMKELKVLVAAAARRPVSYMFGQGATGLRAGDDDTINWQATVEGDRKMKWAHGHERLVRLMLLATGGPTEGKEPEAWAVEYHPLHSPTEKEIAETRKTDMDRAGAAVNFGIASADDVAESFYGGDTYSPDIKINWERRKAQAAIDGETPDDMTDEDMEAMGTDFDDELDGMDAELDSLELEPGGEDVEQEMGDVGVEEDEEGDDEEPIADDGEMSDEDLDALAEADDETNDEWDLDDDEEIP